MKENWREGSSKTLRFMRHLQSSVPDHLKTFTNISGRLASFDWRLVRASKLQTSNTPALPSVTDLVGSNVMYCGHDTVVASWWSWLALTLPLLCGHTRFRRYIAKDSTKFEYMTIHISAEKDYRSVKRQAAGNEEEKSTQPNKQTRMTNLYRYKLSTHIIILWTTSSSPCLPKTSSLGIGAYRSYC